MCLRLMQKKYQTHDTFYTEGIQGEGMDIIYFGDSKLAISYANELKSEKYIKVF